MEAPTIFKNGARLVSSVLYSSQTVSDFFNQKKIIYLEECLRSLVKRNEDNAYFNTLPRSADTRRIETLARPEPSAHGKRKHTNALHGFMDAFIVDAGCRLMEECRFYGPKKIHCYIVHFVSNHAVVGNMNYKSIIDN